MIFWWSFPERLTGLLEIFSKIQNILASESRSESSLDIFHQIGNSNTTLHCSKTFLLTFNSIKLLHSRETSLKLWKNSISQTLGQERLSHAASFVYRRNQYCYEAKWRVSNCQWSTAPVIQDKWDLTVKSDIKCSHWLSLRARTVRVRPPMPQQSTKGVWR